ncbi:5-methylcytosine-specific restriction endonuclease system specificity protein McrC [Rhodoferax sp. TBRC 17660]|uniref:5-methylcytosine-specific restriction endonuclease system specificity protein McrC n=1 Tax=Rhodoferax potami TaxID=3068338 RepID=A0ABU3KL97_9BURK|nr:5-methylcytosine-specific restriction endonuclease system specificity protein McrC [Rhodoferax sp. TBRC 17660]MDT7518197.1 5-methylcytosine-specific restriction endonuclease system specificity protein McrC [Rhodoferax sp. TBRC 17660]
MATPIPLRNIWLLFLYAADLVQFKDSTQVEAESARNLPELLARLLTQVVRQRLRSNLSRGYQPRHAVLSRVRGRIDVLATASGQLLEQGRVACKFEEHTLDTPRNQLVRAALENLAIRLELPELVHECKALSHLMASMGVGSQRPSRSQLATDQVNRNETTDLLMLSLAKMVFEAFIPTEENGQTNAVLADADVHLVRRLFEKAVANALRIQLQPVGWQVLRGRKLRWPVQAISEGLDAHLPGMQTDIELLHHARKHKLVIDTKFTNIFTSTQFKEQVLRSGYLYQLYAYLRTQEDATLMRGWRSEGILLHPQCGETLNAYMSVQGHCMRFMTIDLMSSAEVFEQQLLSLGESIEHT